MSHVIPAAALAQHLAVLGKTGSGKTSTAKLAVEQVVRDGSRVCILDPIKSDWWGLTSSADGKHAGLPFHILGGPRGHVPLHANAGKAIGEIVASGGLPLSILDMADFQPGGQAHFFVDFAPTLIRKMRGVLYLVIEEAHLFAPKERSGIGAENMSIHWAKTLATAGRSKGIRMIVLTQRTQALHNALLGSCDTMIVHRLTAPADQEPVIKWLKANVKDEAVRDQVVDGMSSLKTGSGWLCSGEAKLFEHVQFPRIHTFDNSATPSGDLEEQTVKTAPVDAAKLRAIIGDAVAEAEANDVDALKKRIRELEARPMHQISDPVVDESLLYRERAEGFQEGKSAAHAEGTRYGARLALGKLTPALSMIDELRESIARGIQEAKAKEDQMDQVAPDSPKRLSASAERSLTETVRRSPRVVAQGELQATAPVDGGAARRMLIALAQCNDYVTHRRLGILADVKPGGSTWRGVMSKFRKQAFVDELTDSMRITPAGRKHLGSYEPLPTGKALRDYWRAKIGNGTRGQIFEAILAAGGKPVSAAKVAADANVEFGGSTWRGHMAKLRGLELVSGSTELRASEELF